MLLIAAVIIPTTATASGFSDDKVVFGGNFTLGSGEVLNGDLVVFGGNIVLETSSTINGDTVVLGALSANAPGTRQRRLRLLLQRPGPLPYRRPSYSR